MDNAEVSVYNCIREWENNDCKRFYDLHNTELSVVCSYPREIFLDLENSAKDWGIKCNQFCPFIT